MKFQRIHHYRNRVFEELSFLTGRSLAKPSHVIVVLTNICNARCVHCHSYMLEKNPHELTTHEWGNAFKELRDWLGPVVVTLTGGEILTRKDILNIVEHATGNGFWVEFLTNGYTLDEVIAEKLIKSGVRRITISLDGSSSDVHDKIRGRNGFYEKATQSVKMLLDQNRIQGKGAVVRLKTTIMRLNLHDIQNIPIRAREWGTEGVIYQALEPVYYSDQLQKENWYEDNELWVNNLVDLEIALTRIKKLKAAGYPVINTVKNLDLIYRYFADPTGQKYKVLTHQYTKKSRECRSWLGLQIFPDGGMKMCHFMEPFHNIRDGNLRAAWKSRPACWKQRCVFIDKYL